MIPKRELAALLLLVCATACHDGSPTGTDRSEDPISGAWTLGSSRIYFHPSGVLDTDGLVLFDQPRLGWERVDGYVVLEKLPDDPPDAGTSLPLTDDHHGCAEGPCVELSGSEGAVTLLLADGVVVDDASEVPVGSPCPGGDAGQ
jgi:hypothetical protein